MKNKWNIEKFIWMVYLHKLLKKNLFAPCVYLLTILLTNLPFFPLPVTDGCLAYYSKHTFICFFKKWLALGNVQWNQVKIFFKKTFSCFSFKLNYIYNRILVFIYLLNTVLNVLNFFVALLKSWYQIITCLKTENVNLNVSLTKSYPHIVCKTTWRHLE